MKYRKKPVVIDAVQLQDTNPRDKGEPFNERPEWLEVAIATGVVRLHTIDFDHAWRAGIITPNSRQVVYPGDWILLGTKPGDICVCPNDVFQSTYEPAE